MARRTLTLGCCHKMTRVQQRDIAVPFQIGQWQFLPRQCFIQESKTPFDRPCGLFADPSRHGPTIQLRQHLDQQAQVQWLVPQGEA